jgi:voltage-gated potassium channel
VTEVVENAVDSNQGTSPTRLERYLRRSSTPILVAAFIYLIIYTEQVVWLSATDTQSQILEGIALLLYAVFLVDFVIRVYLAENHWQYILRNPIDLVVIVLPAARSLRILRVFTALRVLFDRGSRVNFGTAWLSVLLAAVLLVYVAALAVLDAERNAPDATIENFPDALWWGFVTVTTVGYGDEFPVTGMGRVVAVFLMLVGIGLLGSVTASVAGWIAERFEEHEDAEQVAILNELKELRAELATIKAAVLAGSTTAPGDDSTRSVGPHGDSDAVAGQGDP